MLTSSSTKLSQSLTVLTLLLASLFAAGQASARTTITSDDPYTLRNLAFQCYLEGQTDSAIEMYQKAVERAASEYGDNSTYVADLYYELGCLAFDAGKERTAESCLQDSIKRNPNAEMARIKLAELLQVRNHPDEALMHIRQALAKNKTSVPARRALVLWLEERGFKALATQESFTLSQIVRGRDHRIAPPKTPDTRVATAAPPPKATKPEPKPETKPTEVVTAKVTPPAFFKKFLKQAQDVVQPKPEKPALPKVAKLKPPEPKPVRAKPQPPPPVKTAVEPPRPQVEAPSPPPPPIKTASAAAKPSKRSNGLVPPPPPMAPTFPPVFMPPPGYQPGFVLRTDAKIKNAQKPKEPVKEAPKAEPKVEPKEQASAEAPSKEPAAQNEDGDPEFILDWASVKGQKKKK